MNRLRYFPIACLFLAGCGQAGEGAARAGEAPGPAATGAVSAMPVSQESVAAPVPASARTESISNDLIEFEYSYPANAAANPALRALLDDDLERSKADLVEGAKAMQAEAKKEGFPFHALGYWTNWQTVTELPGWLSLSAEISTYEGGAHPNHGFAAILWDRQANRRRDPADLFLSKASLSAAIRAPFCRALDKQRREKRGGDGRLDGGISEFDACIDPLDNGTLILGSSNRKAFDRLGILVPPYNAGPYAEGSYEVTLPVTGAVMRAVRPEFRPAFAAGR